MIEQEAAHGLSPAPSYTRLRDALLSKLATRLLAGVDKGNLRICLPSGLTVNVGEPGPATATLRLKNLSLFSRAMRRGLLGFAESYIAGDIETDDLSAVFHFFLENFEDFDRAGGGWFKPRLPDKLAHRRNRNTKKGSQRNIAAHYDLGNDFYALWLDPGMTYSSAVFTSPDQSLEQAQDAKNEAILDALAIKAGENVLEIGFGWGGMAEALLRRDANVTGITLSQQQLRYATDRLAALDKGRNADLKFQDYRDVSGIYDRIVSVEMIEAVGEEHWPVYFAKLHDLLRPGGSAVLQAITIQPESFNSYRRTPDFIQSYIFPGGMLPTVDLMREHAAQAGMKFETVQTFGADYAETLRRWRASFEKAWPRIAELGYDERFRRMWRYYLIYCEVGFERGLIDVGLYRLVRP